MDVSLVCEPDGKDLWTDAARVRRRRARAVGVALFAAAWTALGAQPEPSVHKPSTPLPWPDVSVKASVKHDGPGLDRIDFEVTKGFWTLSRKVSIQVLPPRATNDQWITLPPCEMVRHQPTSGLLTRHPTYRIFPLSRPGVYQYRWWAENTRTSEVCNVQYDPEYRLRYLRGKARATWTVDALPQDQWRTNVIRTVRDADGPDGWIYDVAMQPYLFRYYTVTQGQTRVYTVETDGRGRAELELPRLFKFDIGVQDLPTKVRIYETRDASSTPLGYRYHFECVRGAMRIRRTERARAFGADFNAMHQGRKEYEKWVIWAVEHGAEMDPFSAKQYARESLLSAGVGWLADLGDTLKMELDPVQVPAELIYRAAGGVWSHGNYNEALGPARDYAHDRAAAARTHSDFKVAWDDYITTTNQRDAIQKIFGIQGISGDHEPSYQRMVLSYEWAFMNAWLYGDLWFWNDYANSVLTESEMPVDLLFETGVISTKAHKENKAVITYLGFKPKGTEWAARVTGKHAFRNGDEVWVMQEDGADARAVAAVPAGMTLGQIAWANDASRLAFTASTWDTNGMPVRGEIWTVKPDGSALRKIASGEEPTTDPEGDAAHPKSVRTRDYFTAIDFSPDGSQVSAQRLRCYQDYEFKRMHWEDIELVLAPVETGAPVPVPGTEWVRNWGYDAPILDWPDHPSFQHWARTAWSPDDRLLFARSYAPTFTGSSVYPADGIADHTVFTYQTAYWDPYNKPPKGVWLYMGDTWRPMTFSGFLNGSESAWTNYAHGAVYVYTNTLSLDSPPTSNVWFVAQTWRGDWINGGPYNFTHPHRDYLANVQAVQTNAADAAGWGLHQYVISADFLEPDDSTWAPWVVVDSPAVGAVPYVMDRVSGTHFRKTVTLPLTYQKGETTDSTVRYWIVPRAPGAGDGPHTLSVTRTWPDDIWASSTGGVYVSSSLSGQDTYQEDINGDGTNETVTLSVAAGISATRGRSTDEFLYRARYTNSAGRAATTASVVIDEVPHPMSKVGVEGGRDVYEYRTGLAAQESKHAWRLVFSDGHGTIETGSAAEPWVADVSLSSPLVTRDTEDELNYRFRVTAQQTAGQGECWLLVRRADGLPRILRKIPRLSGDLRTGAVYEFSHEPWYWADYDELSGGSSRVSGSVLNLGEVHLTCQFLFVDGFDGAGSKLAPLLERCGAATPEQSLDFLMRADPINCPLFVLNTSVSHVVMSTPGRAALREDLAIEGAPRGGMCWDESGERLAVIGGTNFLQDAYVYQYTNGNFRPMYAPGPSPYAALSGWAGDDALYVTHGDGMGGGWEYGCYYPPDGDFVPLSVGPLPASGLSPYTTDLPMSHTGPLGRWVNLSAPTRTEALCARGAVSFEDEESHQAVDLHGGQKSRYDPLEGDAGPQPPETVDYPVPVSGEAAGPGASTGLLPGSPLYSSASVALQDCEPGSEGMLEGAGDVASPTPTLAFGMSMDVDPASVSGLEFGLYATGGVAVMSGSLSNLQALGRVSLSVSGSVVSVGLVGPLASGSYEARLSTGGLRGGGGVQPGGDAAGFFRVVEGIGAEGGTFSLPASDVHLVVPPGAVPAPRSFDISICDGATGACPPECSYWSPAMAVAWQPEGDLAVPAALVIGLHMQEFADGTEPCVALWRTDRWELVESQLSDEGTQIETPVSVPGAYAILKRTRTAPDPALTVDADAVAAPPSGELGVRLMAYNRAGVYATNGLLVCALPADVGYVSGSATFEGAYDVTNRTVNWTIPSLPVGTALEPAFRATVSAEAPTGTQFRFTASFAAENVTPPVAATSAWVEVLHDGVIDVMANTPDAACTLTGSGGAAGVSYSGTGASWRVWGAPAGVYSVEFEPVPGRLLPLANHASAVLAPAGRIRFEGLYRPDSDGDGLDDDWELETFGSLSNEADDDPDLDEADNEDELAAGTDPLDGGDSLRVWCFPGGTTNLVVEWPSRFGRRYAVQWSSVLTAPDGWSDREEASDIAGDGEAQRLIEPLTGGTNLFYRVRVWREP